eukprot:2730825-Amphidinium_carterae.2
MLAHGYLQCSFKTWIIMVIRAVTKNVFDRAQPIIPLYFWLSVAVVALKWGLYPLVAGHFSLPRSIVLPWALDLETLCILVLIRHVLIMQLYIFRSFSSRASMSDEVIYKHGNANLSEGCEQLFATSTCPSCEQSTLMAPVSATFSQESANLFTGISYNIPWIQSDPKDFSS